MPAALYDTRFLDSANIQRIVETAAATLERMRPLVYIDRLDPVNATDDEITGRFVSRNIAADVIAPDQKALVYEAGQLSLFVHQLAKIKYGRNFSENQLQQLDRLRNGLARRAEVNSWLETEENFGRTLLHGVRMRQNYLAVGMMTDSLTYDRLGVKFSALSWGMPSNLKLTANPAWSLDAGVTSNAANAHPITDILSLDTVDEQNYGLGPFNRITMSTQALRMMAGTDEFRNFASQYTGLAFALTSGMITVEDKQRLVQLLGGMLRDKELVIDDAVMTTQANDGTLTTTTRYLPANKILLDRTDNGPTEWDWGNAIIIESLVNEMVGGAVIGENLQMLGDGAYGPLAYYTAADGQLNPPGVNAWCVSRGFPRKHTPEASAVITAW
jgi:hypothetical protein